MAYFDLKVLRESELHFMLKYACNPRLSTPSASRWKTQILGALTTPAYVRRNGDLQDHAWMRAPMFRHLYRMENVQGHDTAADHADDSGLQLSAAESLTEAAAVVTGLFAKRLARSLAVPVEDVDVNSPPYAFGIDSLVAVELLFWFSSEIRADIPVVRILGSSTIAQLGLMAAEKSDHVQGRGLLV